MKPNILFILIDSFRGDRFYGKNKNAKTPVTDQLIKNGTCFTQAFGCSDYTFTALGSIFSARFSYGCGISKDKYEKLYYKDSSYLTTLKENGYHAYGHMERAVSTYGFNEPLENDDISFESTENIHTGLQDRIFKLFDQNKMKEPWFYYLHFMDLHRPCAVPDEYKELSLSERYDFNISSIDSCIGKILEKLDLEKTLIVLTADHGEYITPYDTYMGLQDSSSIVTKKIKSGIKSLIPKSFRTPIHVKKKKLHNKIRERKFSTPHEKRMLKTRPSEDRMFYDDVIHVPLLFSGYGVKHVAPINTQVGTVDIFPTIFKILGLESPIPKIDGRSLIPLMNGKKLESVPIYLESAILRTSTKKPIPVIGLRTGDYKYFRDLHDPNKNVNLYDLRTDPLEDHNISKENPGKIAEMEQIITNIQQNAYVQSDKRKLTKAETEELEEELKKLGYI